MGSLLRWKALETEFTVSPRNSIDCTIPNFYYEHGVVAGGWNPIVGIFSMASRVTAFTASSAPAFFLPCHPRRLNFGPLLSSIRGVSYQQ
jgi:hypothetical protein